MSEPTLFLMQSEFAKTSAHIEQFKMMSTPQDVLILMGDAVLFADDERLSDDCQIYILASDLDLWVADLPKYIKVLSYAEFADLILDFKRCISLK